MKVVGVAGRLQGSMVQLQEGSGPVIEAWTPQTVGQVQAWNGTVPDGWELKDSKKGNKVLVEKQQRGGGGWRQSKEAFELEAAGRQRWQLYEQERMDRRTALMQAVAYVGPPSEGLTPSDVVRFAEEFYTWLREARANVLRLAEAAQKAPGSTETPVRATSGVGDRGGATSPPATAPAEPEGGGRTASPGSTKIAGFVPTTPEIEALSPVYPLTPDLCDHKAASGRWLPTRQIDGKPHCPRCGMSAVIYRESG